MLFDKSTGQQVVYVSNPSVGGTTTITGGLTDNVLTDDSGNEFILRDTGTLPFTYLMLTGAPYVPSTNIRAILPLNSATSALQTTGNASLAGILSGIPLINGDGGAQVHVMNPVAIQAVSGTVTANIGTVAGLALDTSVQAMTAAIKATINLTGTVWYDATIIPTLFYVRRESVNEGTGAITVYWAMPDGTAATPTAINLQAVSNAQNIATDTLNFAATAAGVGYAIGDILIHSYGLSTTSATPTILYSIWLNATSGVILSAAPTGGTFTQPGQAVSGSVAVTNFPATQAVSAVALPLPAGAAIAALQPALNGDGGSLAHITNLPATQAVSALTLPLPTGASIAALQPAINGDGGSLAHITNLPATQAVSAVALPLPTGAATSALQAAINGDGGSLVHTTNGALETGGNLAAINTKTPVLGQAAKVASVPVVLASDQGALPVSGTFWQATQPVSGTFYQTTQPVSAATLPLPSGASTAALQPSINGDGGGLAHVTNFPASQAVTGAFYQATQPISAAALPLPVGAATLAAQGTINADLGIQSHVMNFPTIYPSLAVGYSLTQTTLVVSAASQTLIAANPLRKYLAWMVIGTADVTVTAGAAAAVVGLGLVYQSSGANKQGASEEFPNGAPINAFQAIASATGSTVIVWEGI